MLSSQGNGPRVISKYRPAVPCFVVTDKPDVARQVEGYIKNTHCRVVESLAVAPGVLLSNTIAELKAEGQLKSGEKVVCMYKANDSDFGESSLIVRIVSA
jgi:pyruvate kinase